jgi:hypothetical protein
MIEVNDFYKKWLLYLKSKKLYGRYLLDIQSANRLEEERNQTRNERNANLWFDILTNPCKKRGVYISNKDYFQKRFSIDSFGSLQWHLWDLSTYFTIEERQFLDNIFKLYKGYLRKEEEAKKKKELPIPRGFRKKKDRIRLKGSSEENSPWYNSYYQDKKVLWRR